MDYQLNVDFAPMYECIQSLTVFLSKQNHTAMDAGKLWVRDVESRFAPVQLRRMRETMKRMNDFNLAPYIWRCPGDRTVEGFLNWFESLPAGELYELAGTFDPSVPAGLPELRTAVCEMIRIWNEGYFSGIDTAILNGLADDAERKRGELAHEDAETVYERATEGFRILQADGLKQIVLIPQYHARPLVTSAIYKEHVFTFYSCDALPPEPGRPDPALLRLTRALSDETRLQILRLLTREQMSFTEIVKQIGLSKSTIHYHLIALRAAGLLVLHMSGKSMSYGLRPEALNRLTEKMNRYLES